MPIKRFWFYHRQISRLRAEEDLRQAAILGGVQEGENYKKLVTGLQKELGEIMIWAPESSSITVEEEHKSGQLDPEYDRGTLLGLKNTFVNGVSQF